MKMKTVSQIWCDAAKAILEGIFFFFVLNEYNRKRKKLKSMSSVLVSGIEGEKA